MRLTNFKLTRLKIGRLQIEVATAACIPRPRLSEIENGHAKPRPDELRRLALELGVTVEALLDEG